MAMMAMKAMVPMGMPTFSPVFLEVEGDGFVLLWSMSRPMAERLKVGPEYDFWYSGSSVLLSEMNTVRLFDDLLLSIVLFVRTWANPRFASTIWEKIAVAFDSAYPVVSGELSLRGTALKSETFTELFAGNRRVSQTTVRISSMAARL